MRAAASIAFVIVLAGAAHAQDRTPSWIVPDLLAQAKSEGSVTIYSSINEDEALPLWQVFEAATGIKVNYIRGNDAALTSKIMIEARSQQYSWDALVTTSITRLPPALRAKLDLPQAKALAPNFRDADARWFAVYANYNAPAYNTSKITLTQPPASFEDFLTHKEWAGHVGIDAMEFPWYRAVLDHYGEAKGDALMKTFFDVFKPTPVDGHLALARAIGAGEYWVTPSNYVNLSNNVRSSGATVDYWGMQPLSVILGAVAVNAKAPHPNAAALAANFLLSQEGQTAVARKGRLPVRADATPVPPDAITKLGPITPMTLDFSPEQEKQWQKRYQDLLRGR